MKGSYIHSNSLQNSHFEKMKREEDHRKKMLDAIYDYFLIRIESETNRKFNEPHLDDLWCSPYDYACEIPASLCMPENYEKKRTLPFLLRSKGRYSECLLLRHDISLLKTKLREKFPDKLPYVYYYITFESAYTSLPNSDSSVFLNNHIKEEDENYRTVSNDSDFTPIRVTNKSNQKAVARLEEGYFYYVDNGRLLSITRPWEEHHAIVMLDSALSDLCDYLASHYFDLIYEKLSESVDRQYMTFEIPFEAWSQCESYYNHFAQRFDGHIYKWEISYLEEALKNNFASEYPQDEWQPMRAPYEFYFQINFYEHSKRMTITFIEVGEFIPNDYDWTDRYDITDM